MAAEAMDARGADTDAPDRRIGAASQQTPRGRQDVVGNLERSAFDVDRDDLAVIAGLDLGADLLFIQLLSSTRVFFFAVACLRHCSHLPGMSRLTTESDPIQPSMTDPDHPDFRLRLTHLEGPYRL